MNSRNGLDDYAARGFPSYPMGPGQCAQVSGQILDDHAGKGRSRIARFIPTMLLIVLVIFAGYYIYDHNDGFGFDTELKVVVSGSMDGEPRDQYDIKSIPLGSLVWIKKVPSDSDTFYSSLREGDVLTFNYRHPISGENMVVTHRIISIEQGNGGFTYTLKGDSIADDPTNGSVQKVTSYSGDIIGKVSGVSPWLGQLVIFMSTLEGRICLIGIPCAIIVLAEFNSIRKNMASLRRGDAE
ncbi:hypothetical protein PED39_00080 [Methanomassiliicoccales archaeon LGM-RCC1]|nr:hypothetical protein PED39_00080 [Methanomassiliicoccales archaeon LGM-RCC1]